MGILEGLERLATYSDVAEEAADKLATIVLLARHSGASRRKIRKAVEAFLSQSRRELRTFFSASLADQIVADVEARYQVILADMEALTMRQAVCQAGERRIEPRN